jgi:CO/xanthine dehydrogenase FAD-binding subunit
MDLITVRDVRVPRTRDELVFGEGERPLGGGTWLYSEPQPALTGLVDLMGLGWPPLTITDAGLEIAATCTIAELLAFTPPAEWTAWPLVAQCANSLLASFKIWNLATVGGNIALALPAGAMTSLLVALDGTALVWGPSADRTIAVKDLVVGNRQNSLNADEVVRSLHVPLAALRARTGFRRIALSDLGRTGTLVTATVFEDRSTLFSVTGGCVRPWVQRWPHLPSEGTLRHFAHDGDWFTDAHGESSWRSAMSERLAQQLREELS